MNAADQYLAELDRHEERPNAFLAGCALASVVAAFASLGVLGLLAIGIVLWAAS